MRLNIGLFPVGDRDAHMVSQLQKALLTYLKPRATGLAADHSSRSPCAGGRAGPVRETAADGRAPDPRSV